MDRMLSGGCRLAVSSVRSTQASAYGPYSEWPTRAGFSAPPERRPVNLQPTLRMFPVFVRLGDIVSAPNWLRSPDALGSNRV